MVQRWMDGVMGDDAIPMVEPSAGSEQLGKIAKVVGTVEKSGDKEVTTTSGKKCAAYATTVYEWYYDQGMEENKKRKLHTFDGAAPFNLTDEAASMKVTVNADPVPALFEMPHRDSRDVYKLWDPVPNEKFGESGMAGKQKFKGFDIVPNVEALTDEEKELITSAYAAAGKDMEKEAKTFKNFKEKDYHGGTSYFTIVERTIEFGSKAAAIGILASAPPGLKLEPLTEEAVATAGGPAATAITKKRAMHDSSANGKVILSPEEQHVHI